MITVIIPSYKPGEYLKDCLNSLEAQTLNKEYFNILIILNGDIEPYYAKVNELTKHLSCKIEIIATERKGVSNARNVGLEYAEGQYIVFIDDDDKISENYLYNLYNSIKGKENSIAVSNVLTFDEAGNIGEDYITHAFLNSKDKNSDNLFKMRRFLSSACCKIIPRDLIGNNRFNSDFANGEDSLFMASISDKIDTIVLSSGSTIYYRRLRTDSASRSKVKLSDNLKNKYKLFYEYKRIYFSNIRKFNLFFFLSRIVALFINR